MEAQLRSVEAVDCRYCNLRVGTMVAYLPGLPKQRVKSNTPTFSCRGSRDCTWYTMHKRPCCAGGEPDHLPGGGWGAGHQTAGRGAGGGGSHGGQLRAVRRGYGPQWAAGHPRAGVPGSTGLRGGALPGGWGRAGHPHVGTLEVLGVVGPGGGALSGRWWKAGLSQVGASRIHRTQGQSIQEWGLFGPVDVCVCSLRGVQGAGSGSVVFVVRWGWGS